MGGRHTTHDVHQPATNQATATARSLGRGKRVTVQGATTIPAGGSVSSIPDADNPLPAPAWAVPPQPIGDPIDGAELWIVLRDLTTEIPSGIPTDVTFRFRQAGEVTLRVPVCTPSCTQEPVSDRALLR